MEKSLKGIASSLDASAKGGGKSNGALSSLSVGVSALSSATNKFNSKNSKAIVEFATDISKVAQSIDTESAAAFGEFMSGLAAGIDAIAAIVSPGKLLKLVIGTKILFGGKNSIIKQLVSGMTSAFKDADPKKAKEGAEAIGILADALMTLSKAMGTLALIGLVAPLVAIGALTARAIIGLFTSVGKNAKAIQDGGKAIGSLGKGLMLFSAGLATFMLVILIVKPAMVLTGIVVLAAFALAFALLGQVSRYIDSGAKAIAWMGLGLFAFSAALATYMLVLLLVTPKLVMIGIAVLGLLAGAFALIGWLDKAGNIKKGAQGVMVMGEGLFFFAIGLAAFSLAMRLVTMETAIVGPLIIASLGAAFWAVGAMNKGNFVQSGATAMIEVGFALMAISAGILIFGLGLKALQAIFGDDLSTAGIIAGGILLGLGLAFAGIGFAAGLIAPGAAAMISVGFALMSISAGILIFGLAIKGLQAIFGDDLTQAGVMAGGILIGLGLAFAAIGLLSPFIIIGSVAVILMGVSLILFSGGVMLFGLAVNKLVDIFGSTEKAAEGMKGILDSIGGAIASMGWSIIPITLGSAALMLMGVSLMLVSGGLFMFGKAMSYLDEQGLLIKGGDGWEMKGASLLVSLVGVFADIGWEAFSPWPWAGIAFSLAMGVSLFTLGLGLKKAADALAAIPDMNKFIFNLFGPMGVIPAMADAFGYIGEKYGGGLLSSWFGTDPVSMGVRAVRGMGGVLEELAGGIAAFANFSEFPVKIPNPKDRSKLIYSTVNLLEMVPKIQEVLTGKGGLLLALSEVFAEIGTKYGGEGGWFGGDGPTQKGIDAVDGMGKVLSEIAGGIIAFARFDEFPIQIPDPKDPSKLTYKSVNMYDMIPKIKTALIGDGSAGGGGILFSLAAVFGSIGARYPDGFLTDSYVKQGVDAVSGIGGVISELAEGILAFAELERGLPIMVPDKDGKPKWNGQYKPIKLGAIKNNIERVLLVLPSVFAKLDIDALTIAKQKAKLIKPLAESIGDISESLKKLLIDAPEGGKTRRTMIGLLGPSIKQFADDIKGVKFDPQQLKDLDALAKIFDRFSSLGDTLDPFAKGLVATGNALVSFSNGFQKFGTQIEKFSKFEQSFSNLVKNQSTYKFDKFAESVGVLKKNVNEFNVEKLKLTDSMMKSLAIMSKSPDALGKTISDSIEKSFEELIKAIKELTEAEAAQVLYQAAVLQIRQLLILKIH